MATNDVDTNMIDPLATTDNIVTTTSNRALFIDTVALKDTEVTTFNIDFLTQLIYEHTRPVLIPDRIYNMFKTI